MSHRYVSNSLNIVYVTIIAHHIILRRYLHVINTVIAYYFTCSSMGFDPVVFHFHYKEKTLYKINLLLSHPIHFAL